MGNFAVWINNDTEYAENIAAFSKTYKRMAKELPFFIWRDASVQHFQVCRVLWISAVSSTGDLSVSLQETEV